MDVSFTKTVDLRVFCANFGVERGTVRNFAKVTSVKNAVFAVFQFLVVFAEFTFTLEPEKLTIARLSGSTRRLRKRLTVYSKSTSRFLTYAKKRAERNIFPFLKQAEKR